MRWFGCTVIRHGPSFASAPPSPLKKTRSENAPQVKISGRNSEGYSQFSRPVTYATPSQGKNHLCIPKSSQTLVTLFWACFCNTKSSFQTLVIKLYFQGQWGSQPRWAQQVQQEKEGSRWHRSSQHCFNPSFLCSLPQHSIESQITHPPVAHTSLNFKCLPSSVPIPAIKLKVAKNSHRWLCTKHSLQIPTAKVRGPQKFWASSHPT